MQNPLRKIYESAAGKKQDGAKLEDFALDAKAFADAHPECLIVLADPKTDIIFMAHKGFVAPVRMLNKDGSRNFIVRNALKHDRGNADIDRLLLAIDGGIFAIAKSLYNKSRGLKNFIWKDSKPVESDVTLSDGSTLSPIQVVDS